MAVELCEGWGDADGGEVVDCREGGDEEAAEDVGGGVDVLRGVQRACHGDALAPAFCFGGDDSDEEGVAGRLGAERRAERGDQRQGDSP